MLGIIYLQSVPHHMFNEPKEGWIRSRMGPSMHKFMSPNKESSVVFSCLESQKIS
jgi:hypothetical protein